MKQILHFLYILFRPRGRIIICLLLFSAITIAQESPPEEFIFGSTFHRNYRFNVAYYDTFRASGMN
ncbi:MAG: hypothetical protein WBN42_03835, partial [Ignavibacteriaceae bacterium]